MLAIRQFVHHRHQIGGLDLDASTVLLRFQSAIVQPFVDGAARTPGEGDSFRDGLGDRRVRIVDWFHLELSLGFGEQEDSRNQKKVPRRSPVFNRIVSPNYTIAVKKIFRRHFTNRDSKL